MERQLLERQQVGEVKGQELKAALLSPRNYLGGRERHIAAGQGALDGDLPPQRHMADQLAAGLSGGQVVTAGAQPWVIADRPGEGVGVALEPDQACIESLAISGLAAMIESGSVS